MFSPAVVLLSAVAGLFRPFADLQVTDIAAVDDEPHGRAHLVETVFARSPRVDVQGVVGTVVDHFQNV